MNQQSKVFSTQVIGCQVMCQNHDDDAIIVQALLIIYEDGHVEVRCPVKGGPLDWKCGYETKN